MFIIAFLLVILN